MDLSAALRKAPLPDALASGYKRHVAQPTSAALRGFLGLEEDQDPERSSLTREAFRASQALGNMPGPNMAKGAVKAAASAPELLAPGMFIGRMSKAWNSLNAKNARDMFKADVDPKTTWQATGNYIAPDGKWRQEINDLDARILYDPSMVDYVKQKGGFTARDGGDIRLSDILRHDKLFEAYPSLRNTAVEMPKDMDPRWAGYYSPLYNSIAVQPQNFLIANDFQKSYVANNLMRTLLHEAQHNIQRIEGFEPGANADFVGGPERAWRNFGEVEARLTSDRKNLNDETRRRVAPWTEYGLKPSEIWTRGK